MIARPPKFSQIWNYTDEPIDNIESQSTLLRWGQLRLGRFGALEEHNDGPLGGRACKIGRCQVDGLYWERATARLSGREMYRFVSRFEPLVYGVGGDTARFVERELIDLVRTRHVAWRQRFRMNERGGSAGGLGRSGLHAIYLAVF